MIDPNRQPLSMRVLLELANSGELRLWPSDLENVVNAIPTRPVPTSTVVEGVGMRTIHALEHYGLVAVRNVPVVEITAEGRAFLNGENADRPLEEFAAELSRMLSDAPVGRYRTVDCAQCGAVIRIPTEIPGSAFSCSRCEMIGGTAS